MAPRAGLTALEKQTLHLPGIEPRFLDQYSPVTTPAILPYDTKSQWVLRMCFSVRLYLLRPTCFQTCNLPVPKPCVHSMVYPWPDVVSQNPKIVSFQACAAGVQMINFLSYYTMLDGQVDTEEMSKWVYYTGISIHLLCSRYIPGLIGHSTCGRPI